MIGFLLFAAAASISWAVRSPLPLVLYVMVVLLLGAWRNRHGRQLVLYRLIRPVIVLQCVGLVACVGVVVIALLSLGNPILNFSWFNVLLQHTAGSSAAAPGPGGLATTGNVLMEPLAYRWLALP